MPRSRLPHSNEIDATMPFIRNTVLYFAPEEEGAAEEFPISNYEVDGGDILFWPCENGFQFPILINLTEGDDGTWRL